MRHVRWIIPFILVPSCAPAPTRTPETPETIAARSPALIAPGSAHIGDRSWCIVSGEEFTVTDASPKVEHDGKAYYFCCAGCDTDFAAAPGKYIGRPRPKQD